MKSIWKSSEPSFQPKDPGEIAAMLSRNSLSIVDKLKRNVWIDMIITLITSVGLLIYAMTLPSGATKWTYVAILSTLLLYVFYYIKKIALLRRFDPVANDVRTHVEGLISTLSGYLEFYRRSYTVLYPVFFFVVLMLIGIDQGASSLFHSLQQPVNIISLVLLAVCYYYLSTKVVRWFLNRLYGRHLEKLKNLLTDIHG